MELLIPAIDSAKKLFVAWFTGMKMEKIRTIIKEQKNKCKKNRKNLSQYSIATQTEFLELSFQQN